MRALATGLLLVTLGARFPAAVPEHWTALSKTAISITGDVAFTRTRIAFADGTALQIVFERTVRSAMWAGSPTAGARIALYRVAEAANPVLLRGNRLCGTRPTYLSVSRKSSDLSSKGAELAELAAFTGAQPRGTRSDRLCATYTYEAPTAAR